MANIEKELQVRLQLKYDSFENWSSKNPTLRAGEVAIAYLTTAGAVAPAEGDTQHPVLFKVGPGAFNSLPWASALAADVHTWAKKTESEFTSWVKGLIKVTDIDAYSKAQVDSMLAANATADQKYAKDYADGLAKNYDAAGTAQTLIEGLDVTDTAVTGQYVSAVSETDGKISVTRADLPTYTLASGSANGTVAFNGNDIAVKGLGSAAYTDAKDYATAAQGAKADSALQQTDIVAGSSNGTISVKGSDIAVTGLGSAAFTAATAYATADQGAKADSAVQKVSVLGKELTNGSSVSVDEAKTALGLKSAAYEEASAFDAAGSAAAVLGTAADKADANTVYGAKAAAAKAQADIDAFFNAADKGEAALDTLKEIQDFLNSDDGTVQTLVDSVAENKLAIENIVDGTTKVASAANADVAAKASGLDASGEAAVKAVKVDNAVNADQLGGIVAADYLQKSQAPGYDDILTKTNAATLYQPVGEYASAAQGAKADTAVQPAALNDYYTKTEAEAAFMDPTETSDAIDAKITALNLAATYEPIGAETRAKTYADGLAVNYATAAQGAKADSALQSVEVGTGLKVSEKANNKQTIEIDDTVVFVFNCGNASTLVD